MRSGNRLRLGFESRKGTRTGSEISAGFAFVSGLVYFCISDYNPLDYQLIELITVSKYQAK